MAINLKKDIFEEDLIQNINLKKSNTNAELDKNINQNQVSNQGLNKIAIKLIHGNTTQKKTSLLPRKIKVDCDLAAIFLNDNDKIIGKDGVDSCVYWGRPSAFDGGVVLTGDGAGSNNVYMEHLYIDTNKIPDEVSRILITVNVYLGTYHNLNFGLTNGLEISVLNIDTQKERNFLKISERFKNFNCIEYCEFVKTNGIWDFGYLDTPIHGVSVIADVLRQYVKLNI